jgi:general secretion pathway protein G
MKKRKREVRKGFTMIELMAVLIILGLLFTLVATRVADQIDKARVTTTKANLKALHTAVNQFKMDTGRFPSEEEGLMALIEQPSDITTYPPGGYLETTEITKDGWGNDFIYELFPESGKPFVIKSLGADGEEGGEDYDADLLSTDAY